MAKVNSKKNKFSFSLKREKKEMSSSQKLFYGSSLIILSLIFFISFTSYFFSGHIDQSSLFELSFNPPNFSGELSNLNSNIINKFIAYDSINLNLTNRGKNDF